MARVRVAVLGARGIGEFHVREAHRAGADIVAIAGSSSESARNGADELNRAYGIRACGYGDIAELLKKETPEAVIIATPPTFHHEHVRMALENGAHVLCEKPLVQNAGGNAGEARELAALAAKMKRILTVNTQWPAIMPYIRPFIDESVHSFVMRTEPGVEGPVPMLEDHLSHANSMLLALCPRAKMRKIRFEGVSDTHIAVRGQYGTCEITYEFSPKVKRPRTVEFSINDAHFKRAVDDEYRQWLTMGSRRINIDDPFKISVRKFLDSLRGRGQPLIGLPDVLENVRLQDLIVDAYTKTYP